MNIEINRLQAIHIKIALRSTLQTIKELLKTTPRKNKMFEELTQISTNLTIIKNKITKELER